MSRHFTLGISPCPNDTFIFHALVNGKIDTRGLTFDMRMADVEQLNKQATTAELDITKLSCFALANASLYYKVIDAGSALGFNNGPLLIARKQTSLRELETKKVAIPGINTTANFLLTSLLPSITEKQEMLFSDIERAISGGLVDAGLIIHETRFTYQQHGFHKIADLGQLWEQSTGLPVPLGCIAVKSNISKETSLLINQLIAESITYAHKNTQEALSFCMLHAQEMNPYIMKQHIDLYVNQYSQSMGNTGRKSIAHLLSRAAGLGFCKPIDTDIFLT